MRGIGDGDWGCNTLQIRPSIGARRLSSVVARYVSARSCLADWQCQRGGILCRKNGRLFFTAMLPSTCRNAYSSEMAALA